VINEERPMSFSRSTLVVLLALALASPAAAHHRQTPPLVRLTTSGDPPLPRIASPGNKTIALIVDSALGKKVVSISPWRDKRQLTGCSSPVPTSCNLETLIADAGDNADPAVSISGRAFAFDSGSDPLQTGLPGRQVIGALKTQLREVSEDPTGTSVNPTIDATGMVVAFESTGDLAGTGNPGARQIFLSGRGGAVTQVSQGLGTSRNPVLSAKQNLIAFESSSDPKTGADTGIAQIWVGSTVGGSPVPITKGFGPSTNPAVSNDGRIVAFQSTADLAKTLADTGVSQIYAYDTKTQTYARITTDTSDPLGCTLPSTFKCQQDWRVAFVCSGVPYYYMLRGDQRFRVPADTGTTQRVVTELGIHFLVMSTTADLLGTGSTPGNQVYLVNLFKRPAVPVPGVAAWFPTRGLPPL
jgi:WD40-like Beta Propeller Repeat